jgi:hypothetical protein
MLDQKEKVLQRPSLSSLHFQVSLYFGALFSIMFAILVGAAAVNKVSLVFYCFKFYFVGVFI